MLSNKFSYKVLFGQPLEYDHLKIFVCLCYAQLHSPIKDKFGPRSIKYISVGYPKGQKGYWMYDLASKQIFISRDIMFYENIFLFAIIGSKRSTITENHGHITNRLGNQVK